MGITIGIITVRGPEYHPNMRLAEAASEQGHQINLIHPYRVWPSLIGEEFAPPMPLSLSGGGTKRGLFERWNPLKKR